MDYKVITAVATEPVTLAEARLQIKADSDITTEDSLILVWITAAREAAEHYTGLALAEQTLEAALDEFPEDVICLPRPPVATITSVKYTDTAGDEQTISAIDYALSQYGDSRRLAPTYGNYWPTTQDIPDAVRIRYVTGYAATGAGAGFTACPKSVKAAILLMVAWFNEHRGDAMDPDDIQPPAAKSLLNTVKNWAR
jgi:uncharacterized phiE125 gp8 family phage protein